MRGLTLFPVLIVVSSTASLRADSSLPVKTLDEIKNATVFIRIEKDKVASASGSGFLVRVDGDTGYVVTNHHVVHLTALVERRVPVFGPPNIGLPRGAPRNGIPQMPGMPRMPAPPQMPFGPQPGRGEFRTEIVEVDVPAPNITLVFGSGGKQERAIPGEVIATDPEVDLAVVKIKGLKNLPKPISLKTPELSETMQVFLFGFPFGKSLSLDGGNPAITVGRASISSIRTDKNGSVKRVQFDGSANPGNSGGPLVDETGQLVGVVVSKIVNTNIAMAIPNHEVHRLLAGRVTELKLSPAKTEKDTLEVKVEVGLIDPYERLKAISVYYLPTNAVTAEAKKNGLAKVANIKKVDLRRDKVLAVGTLNVPVPDKSGLDLTCQVECVDIDGKTVLGDIKGCVVIATAPKAPEVAATGPKASSPPGTAPSAPPPSRKPPPARTPVEVKLPPILKFDGVRGAIVGVSLQPLGKGKSLTADQLTQIIEDLAKPDKAHGAVKRLHNTAPDPERQAVVARLLDKLVQKEDFAVFARMDAATALRWWGDSKSVDALISVLNDGNPHGIHYRHPAMWSLAYLGGEKAVAGIATRIGDFIDHGSVVKMLQQMGSESEAQALALLDDKREGVRADAARILSVVGTNASLKKLTTVSEKDDNVTVRNEAKQAHKTIVDRQTQKKD